jgi:pre-60S factor REI1
MKTEFHRYNLKRKVLEIAPISLSQFELKLKSQVLVLEPEQEYYCQPCRKAFKTKNSLNSHLISKKHLALGSDHVPLGLKTLDHGIGSKTLDHVPLGLNTLDHVTQVKPIKESSNEHSFKTRLGMAKTEKEINELLDEKEKNSKVLTPVDCLFCTHASPSFEENLNHMSRVHSFYIPDIQQLHDLEGLIQYLADKISIANVCILCNGKGKMLHSLEATRDHMVSKGHCMLPDMDEDEFLLDYYSFDQWEEVSDAEEEDDVEDGAIDDEKEYYKLTKGVYHRQQYSTSPKEWHKNWKPSVLEIL